MDSGSLFFAILFSFWLAAIATFYVQNRFSKAHFPPGPPGWPILGNVMDIVSTEPWRAYKKLGEKYGDLVHVRILTKDVIILNSYEAIRDLFEIRSQNYSDRPHMPINDILDMSWNTGFTPYDNERKAQRKMFQQALRPEAFAPYDLMISAKTRQLLKNMNNSPADFEKHFRTYSTAVVMAATYDYHPASQSDPMVTKLKEIDDLLNYLANPARSAIFAAFPLLTHIPSWFPGATWQRTAKGGRKIVDWWFTAPLKYVQDKMARGPIATCIVADALSRIDEKQADAASTIRLIRGVAASSLFAGSETSDSVLQIFMLAMVLYPDAQKRAQDEIRSIIGTERLPEATDRPNLPYIEAILRETLRWHPALPFSIPRNTKNDDVYRGHDILKGFTILPNVWAIAHDETRYPEPSKFAPSRFFDNQGKLNNDTEQYVFGFGRRICPGRVLADVFVWLAIVRLLFVFSFEAPLDETGQPVKIAPKFTMGLTSRPEHIPVRITLRLEAQKFATLLGMDDGGS